MARPAEAAQPSSSIIFHCPALLSVEPTNRHELRRVLEANREYEETSAVLIDLARRSRRPLLRESGYSGCLSLVTGSGWVARIALVKEGEGEEASIAWKLVIYSEEYKRLVTERRLVPFDNSSDAHGVLLTQQLTDGASLLNQKIMTDHRLRQACALRDGQTISQCLLTVEQAKALAVPGAMAVQASQLYSTVMRQAEVPAVQEPVVAADDSRLVAELAGRFSLLGRPHDRTLRVWNVAGATDATSNLEPLGRPGARTRK